MQTLEAEADQETEALAEASKVKRKDGKGQLQAASKAVALQLPVVPHKLTGTQLPYAAGLTGNGLTAPKAVLELSQLAATKAAPGVPAVSIPPATAAASTVDATGSDAAKVLDIPSLEAATASLMTAPPTTAAAGGPTAAEMDAAMAAAMPVDVSKLLLSGRSTKPGAGGADPFVGRRTTISIPQDFRGPDSGSQAATGQALGLDEACWTVSRDSSRELRGAKRKRPAASSAKTADAEASEGAEAPEEQQPFTAVQEQPPVPAGRPLAVGSRPAWLDEVDEGSSQLNKRRAKTWQDDLGRRQEVEFMLGCDKCDYQRVRRWHVCKQRIAKFGEATPPCSAVVCVTSPYVSACDVTSWCGYCSCVQLGCAMCRAKPVAHRPMARWQPDAGCVQVDVPEAPTFR